MVYHFDSLLLIVTLILCLVDNFILFLQGEPIILKYVKFQNVRRYIISEFPSLFSDFSHTLSAIINLVYLQLLM